MIRQRSLFYWCLTTIQVVLAALIGFSLFFLMALLLILLGSISRRLFGQRQGKGFLNKWPWAFSWCITHICLQGILRVKFHVRTLHSAPRPRERVIVVSPHPSNFSVAPFMLFGPTSLSSFCKLLMKEEHKRGPLRALEYIGWDLFIPREDRPRAIDLIRASVHSLPKHADVAFVIFPDGTRTTKEKLELQREQGSKLTHVLEFKLTGLMTLLESYPDARIIYATSGFSVQDESGWDLWNIVGSTFHHHMEEVSRPANLEKATVEAWAAQLTERSDRIFTHIRRVA